MSLPPNFPLTEQEINNITSRLDGVTSYKGVGVAVPIRDLRKVKLGMDWLLGRFEKQRSEKSIAEAKCAALTTYLQQTEAVLQAYAAGNWDTGTAARQLMNNLPNLP